MSISATYLFKLLLLVGVITGGAQALDVEYYDMTCPFAEMIVRSVVMQSVRADPTIAAGLLRLHFHDCFIQGCDASVLIDSTPGNTAEKDAPPNLSLRGFEVIDKIKQYLETKCPGVVSCADIVALAARDAVFMSGGPFYSVPTGRMDGRRSVATDTFGPTGLPAPFLNTTGLIKLFVGVHGFTIPQLVALSGGHTLGVSHCAAFKPRLSNFDASNDVDPTLDPSFAASLKSTCGSGSSKTTVPFDATSTHFDNVYFRALQSGQGVLTSDETLYTSPETEGLVNMFAMNQAMFFYTFQQGMLHMGELDVKGADQGEVRLNCRKIN